VRFWGNLLGYQLVWFAAVIGAGRGQWWPALAAAVLFGAWQLTLSRQRMLELRLVIAAAVLGTLLDGGLAASGLLRYAAASIALPAGGAPLWILALWCAFALTLTQSLRWLQPRPWLAMLFGAIGGPLAYLGAARGFGAVAFAAPEWLAMAWLALGWALAVVLLTALITCWSPVAADAGRWPESVR